MSNVLYIAVMAGTTYLIRVLPFGFFDKKIESKFIRSFLYYIPFAVLAAMTIPAIFYSTGNMKTAITGTVAAFLLSYFEMPMIVVALAAAVVAFLTGLVF